MADGWDGILYPGETVLWQGQPDPRPDWSRWRLHDTIFGLAFAGFALFWMATAAGATGGPFMGIAFPLLGLPFLVLGLYRAGGKPVPRQILLNEVWGYNSNVTTHTLETHIYRLRQKIEPDPTDARLLVTESGGYRLVA